MKLEWLVVLTMLIITPLYPQNKRDVDTILLKYDIWQTRYTDQEVNPEMIADDTHINITLKPTKELKPDQAPEAVYKNAELALRPNNICLIIDISGSMKDLINQDTGRNRLDQVKELCMKFITEVIRENDLVSVIAFCHYVETKIEHRSIRSNDDRKTIIDAIEKLEYVENGNTFMRKALAVAYNLINKVENKGQYNNWVLLLTDGEEVSYKKDQWGDEESKELVNEIVKKNKEEGIGTAVSTVSIGKETDINHKDKIDHMNTVAELGGGISIFIRDDEKSLSRAHLAALVIDKKELQDKINTLWAQVEFDVTFTLSEEVSLKSADSYKGKEPQIQDNRVKYPRIRLNGAIYLTVSLSEEAVRRKATILFLSIADSNDDTVWYVEQEPISLDNPVRAEGEGFITFTIHKDY